LKVNKNNKLALIKLYEETLKEQSTKDNVFQYDLDDLYNFVDQLADVVLLE